MGKFTVYQSPEIDRKIEQYLRVIVDAILERVATRHISAIVLGGGFGRGEGGVFFSGTKVFPVNDFDISIFPRIAYKKFKNIYQEVLNRLSQELLNQIPIKQIDLGIGKRIRFIIRTIPLFYTVNTHEFVHGHQVLWGSLRINKLAFFFKAYRIPKEEGTRYLYTRGSGLLISLLISSLKKSNEYQLESMIELNKAILAIGDSYLVLKNRYHHSYQKRILITESLDFNIIPSCENIKELYLKALEWKIKPVINESFLKDKLSQLCIVKSMLMNYFMWFESRRLNYIVDNYKAYYNIWHGAMECPKSVKIKTLLDKKFKMYFYFRKLSILPALLCAYVDERNVDMDALKFCKEKMEEDFRVSMQPDWVDLCKKYLEIFHPEGFVQKLLI